MNRLFVDNLTVIDFSYFHPVRGIVGESWIVDVELSGELDEQGMVFDFGHVKKQLKALIDTDVDHKLVVPSQLPGLLIKKDAKQLDIGFHGANNERWIHRSPADSVLLLACADVTPEALSEYIADMLTQALPPNVDGVGLTIRAEVIDGAFYHYSHGLKKHQGNCQRIAHGHRSKIEIYLNDIRDPQLEKEWADRFKDIYIGTKEDIVNLASPNVSNAYSFAYQSQQGSFELTLPARQVYIMNTDTTVELIAHHIADQVKQDYPDKQVTVKAFEGVGKGAIAEA
jgi:6-pyruvoyl-tetrahydropterin synthase